MPIKPKNLLIEIIGNVAAGKTTLAKKLAPKMKAKYLDIDLFVKNPFLPLSAHDRSRWIFTSHLFFSFDRSRQINRVKKQLQKTPVILDQGFQMGFFVYTRNAYQQKYMTAAEYKLLSAIHHSLMQPIPLPDLTIILLPTFRQIKNRIIQRNRDYEKKYSDDYVQGLNQQLEKYVLQLIREKRNLLIIRDKEIKQYGQIDQTVITFVKQLLKL